MSRYAQHQWGWRPSKISLIPMIVEIPLPEYLQDIPRLDETTYRYLGFEMKKGEVERDNDENI